LTEDLLRQADGVDIRAVEDIDAVKTKANKSFPSSTPLEPYALKNSVPPPNVPRPKHRDDTFRSETPNSL
jgi:hypothetical protein